jgi:hypothetical protein
MPQSSNEARILLALQALQNNPKLSLRRASTIYQVSFETYPMAIPAAWRMQLRIHLHSHSKKKGANEMTT